MPQIRKYDLDMCAYGLTTRGSNGEGLSRKATGIMTNSEGMAKHLARKCDGTHEHVRLEGGTRTAQAAIYTEKFCESIVEAYKLYGCRNPRAPRISRGSLRDRDDWDSSANTLEIGAEDEEDYGYYYADKSA